MQTDVKSIIEKQKKFYMSGKTKDINFRISQLKKLREVILKRSDDIMEAVYKDFRKPAFETYASEILSVLEEIKLAIRCLPSWSAPQRKRTPLSLFKARSHIYYDPYGVVLIIGAWNYPVQLTVNPLIGAIAAGNCAVVKPSELSPNTSRIVAEIIEECFDSNYCMVFEGGVEETTSLLNERFDLIMFTGSPRVGKIIARAAAQHMTPTVLELGGKSPCIIDETADIDISVKRIAWGKFINSGQTCVAPDYLIIHEDIKDEFIKAFKKCINDFYGDLPEKSLDYPRIINHNHFDRLSGLLNNGKVIAGGKTNRNELYIEPTVLDNVTWKDPIMQEEIFGPILPVMKYTDLSQAIGMVNDHEKPLALYFFSKNKKDIQRVLNETSSGGVCINATLIHCANPNIPFGGVGNSGMGNYHGEAGFKTFSHAKSVLDKSILIDPKLLYPPYNKRLKLLRRLFG